ncbi:MAG: double-CXXCG motif protein [Vulcanimicrobiota bacterium]
MKFWRLESPIYPSDYYSSYLNGDLEHPYALPGINCNVCGSTWSGHRILPFACPAALRYKKELLEGWPISVESHKKLQTEIFSHLSQEEKNAIEKLMSGDLFQPCYLDVPSTPRADFLWCSLGSLIVSERIKLSIEKMNIHNIRFSDVILRKIGSREAKLPPPVPPSGEPEDIINIVPHLSSNKSIGPYYELIIMNVSGLPPGGEPVTICSTCGREEFNEEARQLVMTQSMWKGDDIFFLATTLQIIITDPLKRQIEKLNPTNIVFSKVEDH